MTSQIIPDEHHITRHVAYRKIIKPESVERSVDSDVFLPREAEKYVSVDWLEYFDGNLRQRLDLVRNAMIKNRERGIGRKSVFAIVNVGITKEAGLQNSRKISVRTTGELHDPSHSGICGLTPDDDIIAQEIALHARVEDAGG